MIYVITGKYDIIGINFSIKMHFILLTTNYYFTIHL